MDMSEVKTDMQSGYETLMDYINSYNSIIAEEQNETAVVYEAGVLHGLLIANTIWLRSAAGINTGTAEVAEAASDRDIDMPALAEIGSETPR